MTSGDRSAHERVEAAKARLRRCEHGVEEVTVARRRAERMVGAMEAELKDLHRLAASEGREVDAGEERVVLDRLTAARRSAEPAGWEGRREVALEAVEAAQADLLTVVGAERATIVVELTEDAERAAQELLDAVQGLLRASTAWAGVAGAWQASVAGDHKLADLVGIGTADVPAHPLGRVDLGALERALAPLAGDAVRDPRRWLPAPMSLVPAGWEPRAPRQVDVGRGGRHDYDVSEVVVDLPGR